VKVYLLAMLITVVVCLMCMSGLFAYTYINYSQQRDINVALMDANQCLSDADAMLRNEIRDVRVAFKDHMKKEHGISEGE
jgi:hypothetical protein